MSTPSHAPVHSPDGARPGRIGLGDPSGPAGSAGPAGAGRSAAGASTGSAGGPADGVGSPVRAVDPGFRAALGAEWAKLRSSRGARRSLPLGTVLGIGLTALVAAVLGATYDDLNAVDRADFDPLDAALAGGLIPAFFFTVVAVKVVTSEFASGMIRLTLTATPRRGRVLAAKGLVVGIATMMLGIVTNAGMLLVSTVILDVYSVPTVDLGGGDALRALIGSTLLGPMVPLMGVAVATLVRGTAAALSTVVALVMAPYFLGMLPGWWQRNVVSLLPGPASDSLAIGHLESSETYLHPIAAAIVVAAWMVGLFALAQAVFVRRDA